MIRTLLTIGYEGSSMQGFLATLRCARVDLVLDVRERPQSRKPGFSKTALAAALAGAGIGYRHAGFLGAPTAVRHQVRIDCDLARYFVAYGEHLERRLGELDELIESLDGRVALLCYEKDPATCHRSSVASRIAPRLAAPVIDLYCAPDAAAAR